MTSIHPVVAEDLDRIAAAPLPWDRLEGATIAITGASGFLPAYLVESALWLNQKLQLGLMVVGLVRSITRARERFVTYTSRLDFELIEHDAAEPWHKAGPVDYLIHAASQASPKFYTTDPVGTLAPNILGTAYLLNLAREKQSRGFLFFSSGEVYGPKPPKVPTAENDYGSLDPLDIRSPYAEGKRAAKPCAWHITVSTGYPSIS